MIPAGSHFVLLFNNKYSSKVNKSTYDFSEINKLLCVKSQQNRYNFCNNWQSIFFSSAQFFFVTKSLLKPNWKINKEPQRIFKEIDFRSNSQYLWIMRFFYCRASMGTWNESFKELYSLLADPPHIRRKLGTYRVSFQCVHDR